MITMIQADDIHVEIIDSKDSTKLWKGNTTDDALRRSLIACSERYKEGLVDFEVFHKMVDKEIVYYVYISMHPEALITAEEVLPDILKVLERERIESMSRPIHPMESEAHKIVRKYIFDHLDATDDIPPVTIFTVWKCKALQNWKFLISSSLPDGMYYELTFNGDKHEWYLDAYRKFENKVIKGGDLYGFVWAAKTEKAND